MRRREQFDAVIVGAGAAGMMCAMAAGQRGRRVLLLDHAPEPGRKILISGGGRCNFTNLDARPERFFSANPHFCRSALARYTQADFVALVDRHGIAWHEKTLGQLFCDGSARQVVEMLARECAGAGVELRLGQRVAGVARDGGFVLSLEDGEVAAPSLVLATGGLSIPKMGATGFAHDVARRLGLAVTPLRPALVPLVFSDADLDMLGEALDAWRVVPAGSEGYAKAEVTLGGIDTRGLSSKTMEAREVPGLYAIGEAVDVTGWLGGYNFQWAWSSGWCAGQAL
jgi:predicted Rossmann fold flavoprotein